MVWNLLPTTLSHALFLAIFILAMVLPLIGQTALSILAGLALTLSVINFWVSIGSFNQLQSIVFAFVLCLIIGLLTEKIGQPRLPISQPQLTRWLLLGFFLAQINSLLQFYPIPFFDQALLATIIFYGLWPILDDSITGVRRSFANHVVFVSLTVILVLGSILWINFPYLKIF